MSDTNMVLNNFFTCQFEIYVSHFLFVGGKKFLKYTLLLLTTKRLTSTLYDILVIYNVYIYKYAYNKVH
jgi:hypothetical protein